MDRSQIHAAHDADEQENHVVAVLTAENADSRSDQHASSLEDEKKESWEDHETPSSPPRARKLLFSGSTCISDDDSSSDPPIRKDHDQNPKTSNDYSDNGFYCRLGSSLDRSALQFGTRMWAVLTVSSLFVLLPSPENGSYQQGTWAFVTACIVSWFPSLDAALVIQKLLHRVLGTLVGSALGLMLGFLSVAVTSSQRNASIFLGCTLSITTWVYSVAVIQFGVHKRCSYACMLGLFTFGLVLLPFHTNQDPKWSVGVWRVVNVFVGCGMGAAGAVLLWPKSTHSQLQDELSKQISKAGESSCAVLHAATDILSGKRTPPTLEQVLEETRTKNDPDDTLHESYCTAIDDWKKAKGLYPLLRYDPFMTISSHKRRAFQLQSAVTLARTFRIQTTIVLLDSILRNDCENLEFTSEQLDLFYRLGSLIKTILSVQKQDSNKDETTHLDHDDKSQTAEAEEIMVQLSLLRNMVVSTSAQLSAQEEDDLFDHSVSKAGFRKRLATEVGMPLAVHAKSKASTLFFLQLVEHLVIRALRLHYAWREHGQQEVFYDT